MHNTNTLYLYTPDCDKEINEVYINKLSTATGRQKYKYVSAGYFREIKWYESNEWSYINRVIRDKNGRITGCFSASLTQPEYYVNAITIMNFDASPFVFGKSLYEFIHMLFMEYRLNKIMWSVYVGNPVERTYDKLITQYGGQIVAYFKEHIMLYDRELVDLKKYQIMKKDFEKYLNK